MKENKFVRFITSKYLVDVYKRQHNIQYRIKSPKSIINKLERKKLEKNIEGIKKINDISGLRVICNYINDIHYICLLYTSRYKSKILLKICILKEII